MDKLFAMRALVEIVDRGSLTAAGAALDRSLPTMVRTLAALEDELGARLLHRTTRRMALTEEGRGYLERVRRILDDIDDAEQALSRQRAEPEGDVRMTAPVLFGQRHVTPVVSRFLADHPKARVELMLLDRVVDLLDEGFDLAVRIGPLEDSSMVGVGVGSMRLVTVASPVLLERVGGPPRHPRELGDRPCVHFRAGLGQGARWSYRDPEGGGGREVAVDVRGPLSTNHAAAAVDATSAGLGFGRFLAYQVAPDVRAGALVPVLEPFEPAPLPVSLRYPARRLLPARVRTFVDALRDGLQARAPGAF